MARASARVSARVWAGKAERRLEPTTSYAQAYHGDGDDGDNVITTMIMIMMVIMMAPMLHVAVVTMLPLSLLLLPVLLLQLHSYRLATFSAVPSHDCPRVPRCFCCCRRF